MKDSTERGRNDRKRVVVIGAGFGGLRAAKKLSSLDVDVTLIDRRNHHLFQPLLYQVASAGLSPSDIAYPIRSIVRGHRNVDTMLAEVTDIDVEAKQVVFDDRALGYDWLIVAAGATHSYFGNDSWAKFAPGLKSIEDALEIRRRILMAFERAELDLERSKEWLTFVVVGAGPTGVELAGAISEIAFHAVRRDFRRIDPATAQIVLIEGAPGVLPSYPDKLRASAKKQLEELEVQVRCEEMVVAIDASGVTLKSGESIECRTVLWAAGVKGSPLGAKLGAPMDRVGRVLVGPDLAVPNHPEVFVIGDLASITVDDKLVPGVAPAAVQAGDQVMRCIRADIEGEARKPFRYRDKGALSTIGRARAVADLGRLKFSGFFAWMTWMFVHVLFLVGFRNRLFVLIGWAWNYVSFRRGARLITGGPPRRKLGAAKTTVAADREASTQDDSTE